MTNHWDLNTYMDALADADTEHDMESGAEQFAFNVEMGYVIYTHGVLV